MTMSHVPVIEVRTIEDPAVVRDLLRMGIDLRIRARGSSMEPRVRDGAPIHVHPWPGGATPRVGQVILTEVSRDPLVLRLHRVIARSGRLLVTQGDAAARADEEALGLSRVLGWAPALGESRWRTGWRGMRRALRERARDRTPLPAELAAHAAWCERLTDWSRTRGKGPLRPAPPPDESLNRWLRRTRLDGAAAFAATVDANGGDNPMFAAARDELGRRLLADEAARVALDHALVAAGVLPYRMRGPALARRWPEQAARHASDIDLWCPAARIADAITALEGAGWTIDPADRPLWDSPARRAETLADGNRVHLVPSGRPGAPPVELHWRPLPAEGAMLLFELPGEPPDPRGFWGGHPYGISAQETLAFGALHWAKHHFRPLRDSFDAAACLREAFAPASAMNIVATAHAARVNRLLFAYLWAARELFGAPIPRGAFWGLVGPVRRAIMTRRFGRAAMLRRSMTPPTMTERLVDLALTIPFPQWRLLRLVRWYLAPGLPYLHETYGRPARADDRTRPGGLLRAWHRWLWARHSRRNAR